MGNIIDVKKLELPNQDDELRLAVFHLIDKAEINFSFSDLFTSIRNKIFEFENIFPRPELTEKQLDIINKAIWDNIWERKLMIDFTDKRFYHNPEIFKFTKVTSLK